MNTALAEYISIARRFVLVDEIKDHHELAELYSRIGSLYLNGTLSIPGAQPSDYAMAAFQLHPRAFLRDGQMELAEGSVMVTLTGHDLPAGRYTSFPYHWTGFYVLSDRGDLVGTGWWICHVDNFAGVRRGEPR